jgi:hypothetical protein
MTEDVMVGIKTSRGAEQWTGRPDQSSARPGQGPRGRGPEWQLERDGDPDRRGGTGMEMEKVSRIVTSGITVWLAILAGMSVFM